MHGVNKTVDETRYSNGFFRLLDFNFRGIFLLEFRFRFLDRPIVLRSSRIVTLH